MRALRYMQDGKLIWWDAPDPDSEEVSEGVEPEIPEGAELIHLDCVPEEFEASLQADCGSNEIGVSYLNDDASASGDKPGKRVGHKRVRAYAPDNPVTQLMQSLGKNSRQSVSWDDLQSIYERLMK